MVCGVDKSKIQVDFLLPGIPWFKEALQRAQNHRIDFGFAKVPCLTVEDFILSKFYSVANRADRFKDLDDLQSVFRANRALDFDYLVNRMSELRLKIPEVLRKEAPKRLLF